jgi:hypothetical protein
MFHANTQRMIDYWAERTRGGRPPARAAIDPAGFRQAASQVFILGREGCGRYGVRLAGDFVRELHGRDLRGADALALWSGRDRLRLQAALEEIRREPAPLVVMAQALAEGPVSLALEIFLAPLAASSAGLERYLGLYQPLSVATQLAGQPAVELSVRAMHRPRVAASEPAASPERPFRLAALHGRRIA